MTALVITKLGQQKGAPRIWIEGRKLEREGFMPGTAYRVVTTQSDRLTLVKVSTGKRKVSARKQGQYRKPIIDIANRSLSRWFGANQKLRIVIRRGRITIRCHSAAKRVSDREQRIITKLLKGEALSIHSLFHGGGVMDKAINSGLARAGVKSYVQVAVEKERKFLDISIDRQPELFESESLLIEASIEDLCLSNAPKCEIVVAGLPCTGASISGKTKNRLAHAEDHAEAGPLFFYFLNWVQVTEPGIIIIENVKQYASTASMSAIRGVLKTLGYSLQERVLNGNEFGALENRDRLCVVAVSNGLEGVFDLDAVSPLHVKPGQLSEALDDVPLDSEVWRDYSYLADKEIRDKANGKGFQRQLFSPSDSRISTITKRYYKGGSTDPFILHPHNPLLSRKVTRNEHARFKGISEDFVAGDEVSETVAHEVMGQSVIPLAFESVSFTLANELKQAFSNSNALIAA